MNKSIKEDLQIPVANLSVRQIEIQELASASMLLSLGVRASSGEEQRFEGQGDSLQSAVEQAVGWLCAGPIRVVEMERAPEGDGGAQRISVKIESETKQRKGVGSFVHASSEVGFCVAAVRAASQAGLLKSQYRAKNQKVFRVWATELVDELVEVLEVQNVPSLARMQAEGIVLEHTNRVASSAVVTSTNYPKPNSVLGLFDNSAWLFDAQGRKRNAFTETDLWLAWYPGLDNEEQLVGDVVDSMPSSPETAIPWVVWLFENPRSWLRFRGAVNLEDHDVLHVLLGRGLQDQDEAFVLGFAMGTSKRSNWLQYWVFKFVLAWLYPEPYRIPAFLQPAFDLGVRCGKETGARRLYSHSLGNLRGLSVGDARRQAEIDPGVLRRYYEWEQQEIPSTIASLRLP